MVRKIHAARVKGRTHRAHWASILPSMSAAMAKEKVTESPT